MICRINCRRHPLTAELTSVRLFASVAQGLEFCSRSTEIPVTDRFNNLPNQASWTSYEPSIFIFRPCVPIPKRGTHGTHGENKPRCGLVPMNNPDYLARDFGLKGGRRCAPPAFRGCCVVAFASALLTFPPSGCAEHRKDGATWARACFARGEAGCRSVQRQAMDNGMDAPTLTASMCQSGSALYQPLNR